MRKKYDRYKWQVVPRSLAENCDRIAIKTPWRGRFICDRVSCKKIDRQSSVGHQL